jgi:DNA invertase Pin-like site-specific DNA recombinase
MMTKITGDHLARSAYVYVRQSSIDQLLHNPESRRRQYALTTRACALGWNNAIVIDDDLGRSGRGTARPGFERLLAAICSGDAGAVFALEASRLARNGRDWHTLLEFCALVGSLIIDEDGVYDPRLVNDRLLLGMKGTFSELELSTLRQRSQEALRLKAARAICIRRSPSAIGAAPMTVWNRTRTCVSAKRCLGCSKSFERSAACASRSCVCSRKESTCQPLCMVRSGGRCGGARRAIMPSIGC